MALFGRGKKQSTQSDDAVSVSVEPQPLMVAEGNNRDLIVWPGRVVIRDWRNKKKQQVAWEKTIRLDSVSAVQLRAPGKMGVGYLQLAYSGAREQSSQSGTILNMETLLDENTIHFEKKQLSVFTHAKAVIEEMLFRLPGT